MSNEWFERGVHDAQNDQLNTTYYQHYYYYRTGYDHARRQMRKAPAATMQLRPRTLALLLLLAIAGAGFYFWRQPRPAPAASLSTSVPATPLPTTASTSTPLPTVEPTPAPPSLHPEGFAQVVNTNGAPLRARAEPSRDAAVQARLPEGSRVKLVEGPVDADGYSWWRVESDAGGGWVAQGEPGGDSWLDPVP